MGRHAAGPASDGRIVADRPRRRRASAAGPGRVRSPRAGAGRRWEMKATSWIAIALLVFGPASPASAYLKFGVRAGGRQVALRWGQTPVRYFVSSRSAVP